MFTLSSILLRLFQSLAPNQAHTFSSSQVDPPRHLALVLAPSQPLSSRYPTKSKILNATANERDALVESIRRAVQWAGEEGIRELSIWDGQGLLQSFQSVLVRSLSRLPPSPPSSATCSPPRIPLRAVRPSYLETENDSLSKSEMESDTDQVTTLTVFPVSSGKGQPQPLIVHLLPISSSGPLLADLTRGFAHSNTPSECITQKKLDLEIKKAMHFSTDPDLLLIHPLTPPPLYRALLPRAAPELGGYPFWTLRITEIYQHPAPLPVPSALTGVLGPILVRGQDSSLPLIRKIARFFPTHVEQYGQEREVRGALRREEWEGAMDAWTRVEQRQGR
ncbi:MAG: hypothetical protein TREMPRED_000106 [Tremellales sp. Tagirdzhanova-0007]|nr:MAG: hypothetical protein TREMPRED_000106 [Tremellales sp. Tagirdzhanova-0007]